jgi:hypothetical protein
VVTGIDAAAAAELACGSWPALEELDLGVNGLSARLTLGGERS